MWFTENPWPGVVIAVIPACYFLMRAAQGGPNRNWVLATLCLFVAVAAYVVEGAIVTPAEEVEQRLTQLLLDCKAGDVEPVVEYISNNNLPLKLTVASGLGIATIEKDVRLTDMKIKTFSQNSRATSHFRANGTIRLKAGDYSGHASTRWEVSWQKEGNAWRIISIRRLHPINGSEINILSHS